MSFVSAYTVQHVLDLAFEPANFQLLSMLSMLSVLRIGVLWRWEAHSLEV